MTPSRKSRGGWSDFDATRPIRSWPGFWARASSRRATTSRPKSWPAEKLQQRRENMKRQLDDAVSGDEKLATKLLRRIQRFDDGEEDEDEDEDPRILSFADAWLDDERGPAFTRVTSALQQQMQAPAC